MEEFSNVSELYSRLIPALNTKVLELKRNNISYIKKEDIWNYLKIKKWKNANNLLFNLKVPCKLGDDGL